jgi:hypothetical protein
MLERLALENRSLRVELEEEKSRCGSDAAPNNFRTLSDAISALVVEKEVSRAEQAEREAQRAAQERIKLRSAVVQSAPKFNGEGVFAFWVKSLRQHLLATGIDRSEWLTCARLCLEGAARDYLHSSEVPLVDFEEFVDLL